MKLRRFQKFLLAFIAFITAMIICRMLYSGSIRFIFLFWNLFLAWIPFQVSLYLPLEKPTNKPQAYILLGWWLLFFPNALYIITDLIHLETNSNVPVWYDAILLFTAAVTGLMMAFASLYKVELFFNKQLGPKASAKLIVVCLFLGSFGVYLGRFLRWNSWDIISNPWQLASEIGERFCFPIEHYRTWSITLLFTCLFSLLYFAVKKIDLYNSGFEKDGT